MLKGKLTKKEFDALAGSSREFYVEGKTKDGQPLKTADGELVYVLAVEDMTHNDDVRVLTSNLETAQAAVGTHTARISLLEAEKLRISGELDEAKKKPAGKSDTDVQAQINAATGELVEKHKGALALVQEQADGYRTHLDTVLRKNAAITALSTPEKGSKRTVGSAELLLPHVLERTKFVEEKDPATGKVTTLASVMSLPTTTSVVRDRLVSISTASNTRTPSKIGQ